MVSNDHNDSKYRRPGLLPRALTSFRKPTQCSSGTLSASIVARCDRFSATLALLLLALVGVAMLGRTSTAMAQATSGSITGFVTDQVGAVIPQAKVSVTDEGTGIVTQATTDGAGFYNVTNLIAGNYTVTVEAAGFKTFSKQHIQLQIDSTVKADAHLEPGAVTEQVTVTALPAQLKTEKTDVDHLLEGART